MSPVLASCIRFRRSFQVPSLYTLVLALLAVWSGLETRAQDIPQDHAARMAAGAALFQEQVGPLLREHCLECHGGEKRKSGFSLGSRADALEGGDQGIAMVPGEPDASPLLAYIRHREEPHMPPKKPMLPADAIAAIELWIALGAPYDKPLIEGASDEAAPMIVGTEERQYWAYRPLSKSALPTVENADWSLNPIDHFIAAEHRKRGLTPAPPIERGKLARRLWFDLTGLPPAPDDLRAFLADEDPPAYEKLVETLLAGPDFGERWARHWLDVARFAESHGFEHDYDRSYAYHYRDFVIRAFNADMPYDQFVRWQIAGDEFAPGDALALMATGFLGAGVYPTQITIRDAERVRYDALDDMVATMGSAMLATTVGCARCHDHKYDPIPTRDYYALLSAFTSTVRSEIEMDLSGQGMGNPEKVMICSEGPGLTPMRHHTSSGSIPDFYEQCYQLRRGDVNQKESVAQLGFLSVLTAAECDDQRWLAAKSEDRQTSLRRMAVARWLTDTEAGAGQLLARVIVNRLWQHHFGKGIVATPNDFGFQGEKPSHPELLDWLAGELIRGGWRLKHLHRLMVLSQAYRMGDIEHEENARIDPENRFLWRRPPRRLEAEAIRDGVLAVSGALDRTMFGPGTLDQSMKRRSVYFLVKRSQLVPILQLFDWPDTLTSLGERSITTTPTQALVFINSPEVRQLAESFAVSLPTDAEPIAAAYRRAFGRAPGTEEIAGAQAFIDAQTAVRAGDRRSALADFCQALFGTNEFIYIE